MNASELKFTWLPKTNAVGTKNNKGLPPTQGEIYNIFDLEAEVKKFSGTSQKSKENPCIMAINTGIRTNVEDITPEMFSNLVFIDIDHINDVVDVDKVLSTFPEMCAKMPSLFAAQKSNRGNLHLIFVDNTFKTKEEYKSTAKNYLCLIIYYLEKTFGYEIKSIKGAMDDSMTNISHLMKVTRNKLYFNPYPAFSPITDEMMEVLKKYFPQYYIEYQPKEVKEVKGCQLKYEVENANNTYKYHHKDRMRMYGYCMIATNFNREETDNLYNNYIVPQYELYDSYTVEKFITEPNKVNKWFKYIKDRIDNETYKVEDPTEALSKFGIKVTNLTLEECQKKWSEEIFDDIFKKFSK